MRRLGCLLGIFAAFLFAVVIPASAAGPSVHPGSDWSVFYGEGDNHVPIGQNAMIEVIGPPASTFTLALIPPPWNGIPPVFSGVFQTSNATATAEGVVNVSIPTGAFGQAEYLLSLSVGGDVVNTTNLWLVPTFNDTYLNNTINQLQTALTIDEEKLLHAQETVASNVQTTTNIEWGFAVLLVLLFIWEAHTWKLRTSPRYLRRGRDWWDEKMRHPGRVVISSGPAAEAALVPIPLPQAWYVGRWPCCRGKPWALETLRTHCATVHQDELGPAGPVVGRDILTHRAYQDAARRFHETTPTRLTRDEKGQQRRASRIDLSSVLGR